MSQIAASADSEARARERFSDENENWAHVESQSALQLPKQPSLCDRAGESSAGKRKKGVGREREREGRVG